MADVIIQAVEASAQLSGWNLVLFLIDVIPYVIEKGVVADRPTTVWCVPAVDVCCALSSLVAVYIHTSVIGRNVSQDTGIIVLSDNGICWNIAFLFIIGAFCNFLIWLDRAEGRGCIAIFVPVALDIEANVCAHHHFQGVVVIEFVEVLGVVTVGTIGRVSAYIAWLELLWGIVIYAIWAIALNISLAGYAQASVSCVPVTCGVAVFTSMYAENSGILLKWEEIFLNESFLSLKATLDGSLSGECVQDPKAE